MRGKKSDTLQGNASAYQVNPVSRTTGERRAEFVRAWGAGFEQEGGRIGGATQSVRGDKNSFKGTNLTVVEGTHPFSSPAWYCLLI